MIMKMTKTIFLILSVLSLKSCMLFAIPVVYAVKQNATYSQDFDYNTLDVYQATLYKLDTLDGINITKNTYKRATNPYNIEIDGTISSEKYKGKFVITIDKITYNSSKFTIKYDIFGDKIESKEFMLSITNILENQSYKTNYKNPK